MNLTPVTQVLMKCPQCFRLLHLSAPEYTDEDGDSCVDGAPLYRAVAMHMSYGCGRRRS